MVLANLLEPDKTITDRKAKVSVRSHKGEIRRIPLRLSKGFCRSSGNVI